MAKDFVGMQVAGINANPHVPVHAGLAKFLKEHKAWNDKWKVASWQLILDVDSRRGTPCSVSRRLAALRRICNRSLEIGSKTPGEPGIRPDVQAS